MEVLKRVRAGDLTVHDYTCVEGILTGYVVVDENAVFEVVGILNGDIVAKCGAKVIIRGIVQGDIINRGGYVEIFGMVKGMVDIEKTVIHTGAIVNDKEY